MIFKNKGILLAGILVILLGFLLNLIPLTVNANDTSKSSSLVFTHPIIIRGVVDSSSIQTISPFSGSSTVYSPSQIKTAYNFPDISTSGRYIAIVEAYGDPTLTIDVATFDSRFGLTTPTINTYYPGGNPISGDAGWASETAMDVEWAQAMAPGATIDLVIAPDDNSTSFLASLQYAINTLSPAPSVISMSFGVAESSLSANSKSAWETLFASARAKGILLVASSGDEGAYNGTPSLSVNYPASSQYVIGVGGTDSCL